MEGEKTMNDCEKLVEELAELMIYLKNALDEQYEISLNDCFFRELAYQMVANGVTFATDNNDGGKWVPVTEGLPKYTGIYFTTNTKAAGKIRVEDLWFEDGQFYEATYGGFKERKVTHWAKLPEPPKGD